MKRSTYFRQLAATLAFAALSLPSSSGAAKDTQPNYAGRLEAIAFVERMAEQHGFERQALQQLMRDAHRIPKVIRAITPSSDPRVRSWQRYQARYIEPVRIEGGLKFWSQHEASLAAAQARYGVPAEIIVAIIGVETIYGRFTGGFPTLSALATLAFDYPPRSELFLHELEELLLLARESGRDPRSYRGSYAGALGLPQFLPSSVRRYATDFDGDSRIDLLASPDDAIGSVAHFLAEHGWRPGGKVTVPATVGKGELRPLLDAGIEPTLSPKALAAAGVAPTAGDADGEAATLIDLVTPDAATEYWLGYRNFYVITRYNRSSFYAMAVFQLGEALRAARHP